MTKQEGKIYFYVETKQEARREEPSQSGKKKLMMKVWFKKEKKRIWYSDLQQTQI
jgi:hypothetical protein